jgi:ankyrin repeat protein
VGFRLLRTAASRHPDVELVTLLLDRGANVNAQGGKYSTALQAAAASKRGSVEKVRLLLDRGANVNAQGGKYGSALQAALHHGHAEVAYLLLDRGAVNTPS